MSSCLANNLFNYGYMMVISREVVYIIAPLLQPIQGSFYVSMLSAIFAVIKYQQWGLLEVKGSNALVFYWKVHVLNPPPCPDRKTHVGNPPPPPWVHALLYSISRWLTIEFWYLMPLSEQRSVVKIIYPRCVTVMGWIVVCNMSGLTIAVMSAIA